MKRAVFILLVAMVMVSCATTKFGDEPYHSIHLDFIGCGQDLSYSAIKLKIPSDFSSRKSLNDHGFCEYRFEYPNGVILYISSNIYDGSSLNHQNRYEAGIETYSNNRKEYETIKNGGTQSGLQYWSEWIIEEYVIGYLNNPDSMVMDELFKDIELVKKGN